MCTLVPSRFTALPKRLADLVETPICLVSVGRRRDQTIILDPEMMQM